MLLRKSPRALALLPLSIAAVLSTPVFAEERTPAADEPQSSTQSGQAKSLDTVLVTGARTGTRTVKNSAVAIDVVAAEDLLATGKGNLLEALQYSLPSLSQNGGYQGDQENLIRGYQLRNLSPGYTLVLVNGKRRNASAYASASGFPGHSWTDLALIPVSAIDRIEVLRDGASAIYGSDAIAGVINVILKSAAQGGNVSIESGQSYEGDGDRTTVRGSIGLPWGDDGFVNIAAESSRQHHAIRAQPFRDDYLVYPGIDADGNRVNNSNVGSNGVVANPLEATRNNNSQIINSSPDYDLKAFALNAGRGLGENADFYATLTASDRDASAIQNFRTPNTVFINNPDALDVWPDGFSPVIQTKDRNYTGTAGVKGVAGGWDWDASVSYNRDTVRTYTNETLNYDLSYPGSPTDFYDGQVDYRQTLVNLDLRRGFDVAAFATPLDFSIGAEYQHEQYQRSPGQPESYYDAGNGNGGASGFIGFAPEDSKGGNRNGKSLYAGLATNVTERWYVDLAARYEDHSDFGNVSTGRLSTRFDFNDSFGVRATASNGFKSPGLATQYYQVTGNCPCATFFTPNVNSDVARALGAQPLQPEKSTNYSIGLTFDPTRNFHAALDVYQIEVRNRLYTSPSIGYFSLNYIAIPDGSGGALALDGSGNWINATQQAVYNAALANAGLLAPETGGYLVSYFWNFGDTRTRGAELTLEATQDTSWGRLRYNYAVSYSETDITKTNAAPQFLLDLQAALGLDLTAEPAYSLRHGAPALTQVAGVNWRNGPWNLNLNLQHYGPQKQLSGSTEYEIDASLLVGISGSREFGKGWRVDVGVDNLTDETSQRQPDFVNAGSAYQWAYNTSDRVGTTGGYYYARLNYTF